MSSGGAGKQPEIWYNAFDPDTGNISLPRRLTTTRGISMLPVIAAGPGAVALVWQERARPDWQVFYVSGTFGGG